MRVTCPKNFNWTKKLPHCFVPFDGSNSVVPADLRKPREAHYGGFDAPRLHKCVHQIKPCTLKSLTGSYSAVQRAVLGLTCFNSNGCWSRGAGLVLRRAPEACYSVAKVLTPGNLGTTERLRSPPHSRKLGTIVSKNVRRRACPKSPEIWESRVYPIARSNSESASCHLVTVGPSCEKGWQLKSSLQQALLAAFAWRLGPVLAYRPNRWGPFTCFWKSIHQKQ